MIKYILFSLLLILLTPSFGFSEENEELTKIENQTVEEFTEAATATGLIYNGDFIPVNVPALYDAYTSNPTEFKQTAVYKFLTQ